MTKEITILNADEEIIKLDGIELDLGGISMGIGEDFVLLKDNGTLEEIEGAYWDIEEFREDASLVFGAIFGCITTEAENVETRDEGKNLEATSTEGVRIVYPTANEKAFLEGFALEANGSVLMVNVDSLMKEGQPLKKLSDFISKNAKA